MRTLTYFHYFIVGLTLVISAGVSAGSWQNSVSKGGFNKVHIYTPDSVSEIGNGRALLIVLHGCTQSIDAYLTANLEAPAEQYGMVVAVPDAMNKAGFSCWSYWQGTKSRNAGDYKNLISLAQAMTADSGYNIDPDQVYIAGLSSGASFANTTACIAPDIFAGVGVSAGPSIGTSSSGAIGTCESANVAARCQQYAGNYSNDFSTQIASIAQGTADTTVSTCYNRQNAEGMAQLYDVPELPGSNTLTEGTRTADEFVWQNGRVTMLWLNAVDHAWSAGQGSSGSYISATGINYANYLGAYFRDNNLRVDRNQPPELSNVQVTVDTNALSVSGTASDTDGTVESVEIYVKDDADNIYQYSTTVSDNTFSLTTGMLADGLYIVNVNAIDNAGAVSDTVSKQQRLGPPPAETPPVLSNLFVQTESQCARVNGEVSDVNLNLASVTATFSNGDVVIASVNGNLFMAEACSLPGGAQDVTITALDLAGLSTSQALNFTIDVGVTATLDQHIGADRLDYTNYANCYLEYGTNSFKLNEVDIGASQCQWQDNDASCVGPTQSCDGSAAPPPVQDQCVSYSTTNYQQKISGRAYSTGNPFAPDYFATG